MTITIGGALVGIGLVAAYQLVRITSLLMEANAHLREIASHARRIPIDPKD